MFGSLRYNIGIAQNSNGPVPFACIKRKQGNFKPEVPFQNNTGLPWTASQKNMTTQATFFSSGYQKHMIFKGLTSLQCMYGSKLSLIATCSPENYDFTQINVVQCSSCSLRDDQWVSCMWVKVSVKAWCNQVWAFHHSPPTSCWDCGRHVVSLLSCNTGTYRVQGEPPHPTPTFGMQYSVGF